MGEVRRIDSVAKLSGFSVMNSDFTRARCRVMYTGRNRNRTDITESALNKLISRKGYANVPVVAHLYKGSDGKWRVGGHDSKIQITAEGGFEIIDETVPFGVIPEGCNPSFEDVTETSGEVKRYFCVDIILWTHRYNIMDAVKSDELWFNQSMEIEIKHCDYDRDDYCVIDDFNLSALCLLNHDPYNRENEVTPCFPSSGVNKFELGNLQNEFDVLLDKWKEYEARKKTSDAYRSAALFIKKLIEETEGIDLDITQVKSKLDGEYFALSCSTDSVVAMRKKDFEIFEIPFKTDAEKKEIVFEYGKAVKKYMAVSDKDGGFSAGAISEYVETVKADIAKGAEKTYSEKCEAEKAAAIKDVANKYSVLAAENAALKSEYEKAVKTIETYKAAEEQAAKDKHKAEIDAVVKKYNDQLYQNTEFMMYKSNIDYSKTAEQVEQDMFVIIGKQASQSGGGVAKFSANWGAQTEAPAEAKTSGGRYGDLFSKFRDR